MTQHSSMFSGVNTYPPGAMRLSPSAMMPATPQPYQAVSHVTTNAALSNPICRLRRQRSGPLLASASSQSQSHTNEFGRIEERKREHLIWEPGFGRRFLSSLGVLICFALGMWHSNEAWVQGVALQAQLSERLQSLAFRLEWWSLIGMLSSSCCVLQLVLNSLSLGCGGFNTWLGPVRPQLLSLTLLLQLATWRVALGVQRGGLVGRAAASTALTLLLSFLPELLHAWAHRRTGAAFGGRRAAGNTAACEATDLPVAEPSVDGAGAQTARESSAQGAAATLTQPAHRTRAAATDESLLLRVSGMGCTACSVKVKATLGALPGVRSAEVDFGASSARLQIDADADAGALAALAALELERVGFAIEDDGSK